MKIESKVLPGDKNLAIDLQQCAMSSLERARLEMSQGNIEHAEYWVFEFNRCKRDLERLYVAKLEHDALVAMAEKLKDVGVKEVSMWLKMS